MPDGNATISGSQRADDVGHDLDVDHPTTFVGAPRTMRSRCKVDDGVDVYVAVEVKVGVKVEVKVIVEDNVPRRP